MNLLTRARRVLLPILLVALLLGTPLTSLIGGEDPDASADVLDLAGGSDALDLAGASDALDAMASGPEATGAGAPGLPSTADEASWDFWANGSFGGDDRSLLRMLAHVDAMPDTSVPVDSHALGLAVPPDALPGLYEALARSSATPLRDALLAYHGALDLLSPERLFQDGALHAADDMPADVQVAIAVLLYALGDASLLQKEAVSGLSVDEYTQLVAVPGAIQAGRLDPSDESPENRAALDAVTGLLGKVDKGLIDDAGMITTHAVAHAMPTLRTWSEQEQAARDDPHVQAIDALVGPYTPQRIAAMDPIERLSILAETLRTVAGIQGTELGEVEPLPAPEGERPLRAAVLDLVGALGGSDASAVVVDGSLEDELTRADQLPHSMQVAAARIVANQAGLLRAQLDVHAADLASGDASLARAVREAELRVVMAVQESAPTLEAWGLYWSHHGQAMLPASPADAPGKLGDAARLGQSVTGPQAGLQEVMQMAGQVNGLTVSAAEAPPLPPRGALGDAVLSLYGRYGIVVEDAVRDDIVAGAAALPPEVEQNAARILLAQLDALGTVEETQARMEGQADPERALATAQAIERLLAGEPVDVADVQAMRTHYTALDEAQSAMLNAAATLAAALDASANELEVWAGYVPAPEPEVPEPAPPKKWYQKAWSAVKDFQVIGTASAQSLPGEPYNVDLDCPGASPLADCEDDRDVWFIDPLLETVVVSGFGETKYDPKEMGKSAQVGLTPNGVNPRGQMLTLDLGGNDEYLNNAGGSSPPFTVAGSFTFFHPTAVSVALDLNGNDIYSHYPPEDNVFPSDNMGGSVSLAAGAVTLTGGPVDAPGGYQGAGVEGIGILWDRRGNDVYEADQMAQGFGGGTPLAAGGFGGLIVGRLPGVGILIDGDGRDSYTANEYAQGTGYRDGSVGILIDLGASDGQETYTAADNAQGAGIQGGVGILVNSAGNTQYLLEAGGTGQGGGRTNCPGGDGTCPENEGPLVPRGGIGILVDGAGDDEYRGGQQGFGSAMGVLIDLEGSDTYTRQPRPQDDGFQFKDGACWTNQRVHLEESVTGTAVTTLREATGGGSVLQTERGIFVDLLDMSCGDPMDDGLEGFAPTVPDIEDFLQDRQDELERDVSDDDGDGYPYGVETLAGTDPDDSTDYLAGLPDAAEDVHGNGLPHGSPYLVRVDGVLVVGDAVDTPYPTCIGDRAFAGDFGLGEILTVGELPVVGDPLEGADPSQITAESCEYLVSLDLAGIDTYNNRAGGMVDVTTPLDDTVSALGGLLVDFGGHDIYYASESRCAQGCGGILIDLLGDDEYTVGAAGGQGVAVSPAGTGLLFDADGDDTYDAHDDAVVQGSVPSMSSGTGILLDAAGGDEYRASTQGVVAEPFLLGGAVDAPAVAMFLDLAGVDTYQPVGQQGKAAGGLLAAFVDAGGQDAYVGSPDNPGAPDRSAHHNDWMRVMPGGRVSQGGALGLVPQSVTMATSVFLDSGRDDEAALLDVSSGSPYRVGQFQIKSDPTSSGSGAAEDDTYLEDYTLLIDPAGDDTYRNNAGATVLRATSSGAGLVYDPAVNYPLASLLIDMAGDDRYLAQIPGFGDGGAPDPYTRGLLTQGAGFLGVGALVDEAGDDIYSARSQSQGFGLHGWGVLWDRSGDDTYRHDTEQLRRLSVDRGLVAWEQAVIDEDLLQTPGTDNAGALDQFRPSTWNGAWNLKVKDGVSAPCDATTLGGSTVHGTTVQDGRIATSIFDQDTGFWDLYRIDFEDCASLDDPRTVSGSSSNKIHPRFATFPTSNPQERILWQDDRDGTWSLYHKARTASTTDSDTRLHLDAATALAGNQAHPDASGGYVVYQDDRARAGCSDGAWAIYLYYTVDRTETRLSPDDGCDVVHILPRIAGDRVVWQTLSGDSWHVMLYDRQTGVSQVITAGEQGDHHSPVVAGDFILYASEPEPGQHRIMQYHLDTGTSTLVQDAAAQPAIDARSLNPRAKATWIDTAGDAGSPVASDAWQIRQRFIDETTARGESLASAGTVSQWLQGASQFGGVAVLFDEAGQDTYRGDAFAQGVAGGPGTGALVDVDGNDAYAIRQGGQGAHIGELPGHGLLMDVRGNDAYAANGGAQGFRSGSYPTSPPISGQSLGLFVDLGGADAYQYGGSVTAYQYGDSVPEAPSVGCEEPMDDPVDVGSRGRNNAVWAQEPIVQCVDPPVSQLPLFANLNFGTLGGTGVDAPMFETANEVTQALVEQIIDVTAKVHVGGVAVGENEEVQGQVEMVAEVDAPGFEVDRVEFLTEYRTGDEPLTFRGYAQDVTGNLYTRPWQTDTDLYPDGEYRIQVRVHYRPEDAQTALGYVEAEVEVKVDNVPRILNLERASTSFSPFPFGDDVAIPGHLEFGFDVTPDPLFLGDEADAWVRVQVLNVTTGDLVATVFNDTVMGGMDGTWNGTSLSSAGTYEAVSTGSYEVLIEATDLDPPDFFDRVTDVSFPVRVYSDTPTAGCVYVVGSQDCNAGDIVNLLGDSSTRSDGSIDFDLEFGLDTQSGISDRRYHVFEGEKTGGGIEWTRVAKDLSPVRQSSDPATYRLNIADGRTKHVLVLGEDAMGNLECMPDCGHAANASVQPGGGAVGLDTALRAALANKTALSGNGTFPAHWPQGGLPVYANFTADLQRPTVGSVAFIVDDEPWPDILDPPRLNGDGDRLRLTYTISDTAEAAPRGRVEWTNNDQSLDQDSIRRIYEPGNETIQQGAKDASKALPTYNVTWDDWSNLAAGWPEGRLLVKFDVRDAAGNPPRNPFPAAVILDKTAPDMAVRVEYPEGQFHVENGQNVTVFASGSDPAVSGSTDRDLSWCIDASNATHELHGEDAWCIDPSVAQDPVDEDPCLLRFGCISGNERSARVPVELVGEGDTSLNLVVFVRDSAGNVNQTVLEIVVGAPGLDPHVVQEEAGVFTFNTTWSTTPVPTNATLQYWMGSDSGEPFLAHSNTSATEHDFELTGLVPGSQYVYRVLATNATDAASREFSGLRSFQTSHGVRLNLHDPAAPTTISGLHPVRGEAWALSSAAIEPRVSLRLHGPGLPDTGKVILDDETEGHEFGLDLVTSALQDGVHRLNATASYLGETVWSETTGLLVDNTPPKAAVVSPAHQSVVSTLPTEVLVRVREDANPIDVTGALLVIDGAPVLTQTEYIPDEDGRFDGVLRFEVDFPDQGRAGLRTLEAIISDEAGNLARASSHFLYDPGAPAAFNASVAYPPGQEAARPGQWITLRVEADDDHTGVARVVANATDLGGDDDAVLARDGGSHALEIQVPAGQAEGTIHVPLRVQDGAGNIRTTTVPVVVDTTPPTAELVLQATGPEAATARLDASEPVTVTLRMAGPVGSVEGASPILLAQHVLDLTTLRAAVAYEVEVTVRDRAGHEVSIEQVWEFLPDTADVPPVQNLTAAVEDGAVHLRWDAPAGQGFRYTVHRADNGTFAPLATVHATGHVDADVAPGAAYHYFVQALDPRDRHGLASNVVNVFIPATESGPRVEAVSVRPQTGIAQETVFVFTATLRDAHQAAPPAWLILGDGPRRMTPEAGQDCRDECTLQHATRLAAATLRDAAPVFHVEIEDADFLRAPALGSLDGPTVRQGPAAGPPESESTPAPLPLVAVLLAALFLRSRRNHP